MYATVKVENTIYSSIIYAKSRLMLVKPTTVPKAELLAAEVEAKLRNLLKNN